MNRRNNIGRIEVWICRDWDGSHIFWGKPERINNGNPEDEWCEMLSILDNIVIVKNMVNKLTYGWDINHKPEKITIKFEIL